MSQNSPQIAASQPSLVTGLCDQQHFSNVIDELAAQRVGMAQQSQPLTLALLQLENFYEITSWVGSREADMLLSELALLLTEIMPGNTLICNCQHHEFALLLTGQNSIRSAAIARHIKLSAQRAVSSSIPPQLELKCAVGLAVATDETGGLIPGADILFARARRQLGLNHEQEGIEDVRRLAWSYNKADLLPVIEDALHTGNCCLNYQAIASLEQQGGQHFEARIYLSSAHEARSKYHLEPMMMIETAVQNAQGETVDRWVIEQVAEQLSSNSESNLCITVNITQNTLVSTVFFPWLELTLARYDLHAQQLIFQIDEIDLLCAQHHMTYFSKNLKRLGVAMCINNFGCTDNPFRYMPLLRARYVKLHPPLLDEIAANGVKQKQLKTLLGSAEQQGLKVIAAKIERMTDLPLLWKLGIEHIQGYCLQKPQGTPGFDFVQHIDLVKAV